MKKLVDWSRDATVTGWFVKPRLLWQQESKSTIPVFAYSKSDVQKKNNCNE